ncbi:MAG TPA: DUF503 domain-containing protein [Candidatus Deferrimicrobium sp.]|nr:DUF503 domain-containing protein [Candidatus Deferrimicrobium sp.]
MIIDLHSRTTHSLKEKRHIVTGVREKLKNKFNISIIESDYQDVWQDIQLAVAMVANSRVMIEKAFDQIEDFILLNYPVSLTALHKEYV